jgi:hypothetical protein
VQYADSGVDDVSAEIDEATNVSGGRRRDDGIAILEGVVTTEVPPDDEPPTADLDVPQPVWNQQLSGPRPVQAAATGSAAAGERTSSGELPVSVTPPAWDSGQRRPAVRDLPRLSKEQVQAIYDAASSVLPDVGPARTFTPVG